MTYEKEKELPLWKLFLFVKKALNLPNGKNRQHRTI